MIPPPVQTAVTEIGAPVLAVKIPANCQFPDDAFAYNSALFPGLNRCPRPEWQLVDKGRLENMFPIQRADGMLWIIQLPAGETAGEVCPIYLAEGVIEAMKANPFVMRRVSVACIEL